MYKSLGCNKGFMIAALLFVASSASIAGSINLVQNPGFETGDLTDWTLTNGQDGNTGVANDLPRTGMYELYLANNDSSDAVVTQTLTDVIGQNYTFSFWQYTDGMNPSDFSVYFGATNLLSETNLAATAYTQFSYTVVGTGSDTISFHGFDTYGNLDLDDVGFVTADSSAPEPSTLMLTGLGCVGLLVRKRMRVFANRA